MEKEKIVQKTKMVKVKLNLATANPFLDNKKFNEDLENKGLYSAYASNNAILEEGTELEVPEDIAQKWCNEKYKRSSKFIGEVDLGLNPSLKSLVEPEITYRATRI